jgi:hypothetical protein
MRVFMEPVVFGSISKPSMDFHGLYHSPPAVQTPCRVVTPSEMTTRAL